MKYPSGIAAALFLGGLLFCSCETTNFQPPQPAYEWHRGTAVYLDRNHDNWIDLEISGMQAHHDGVATYKADTNYDGYYDIQYGASGTTGGIYWSNQIHEPVPVPGKGFVPVHDEKSP